MMADRHPPVQHAAAALKSVATLFGLVHIALAYFVAFGGHDGNAFAAIIYAVVSLGGIGLGYWLVRRSSLRYGSLLLLVLGLMFSWGMLNLGNWLLMVFK